MIPENGLIALNVPLEITRVGSFSTMNDTSILFKPLEQSTQEFRLGTINL